MKKFYAVLVSLLALPAYAAPSHIQYDGWNGYNVTYNYTDKPKSGWYVGGRAELSFLNFKNKYSSNKPNLIGSDSDKYSFEPVFGGSLAFGHRFNYFWRGEIEGGVIGYLKDADNVADYTMTTPYLMLNGYYDFLNGLYVGAGVGIATPRTTFDGNDFVDILDASNAYTFDGDRTKWSFSPIGAIMLGWSHELDDNIVLDIRYRFAGFGGMKLDRDIVALDDSARYDFQVKTGFVMDNSISIGLRYEF